MSKLLVVLCLVSLAAAVDIPTFKLLNGRQMPVFGLGTWQALGDDVYHAVKDALHLGYRHFDTAWIYGNHKEIGRALKEVFDEGRIKRDEVFITTKVWETQYERNNTKAFVKESLRDLNIDYIDLVLIHFPNETNRALESYHALEEAIDEGTVLAAGISNYNVEQAQEVWDKSRHKPVNVQNQCHPQMLEKNIIAWCNKRGVAFTAHHLMMDLLKDPTVQEIGTHYNKTNAQILIKFELQRGLLAIPKTVHKNRLVENMNVFDFTISDKDMQTLMNM